LDRISPQVSAQRRAQIEDALREVLSSCQACCGPADDGAAPTLLPLGSYHLGVMLPNDEVDVLFTAPLSSQPTELCIAVRQELERRGVAKNLTPAGRDGILAAPGFRCEVRGVAMKVIVSQNIPALPPPRDEAIVQNMAGVYNREAMENILMSVPNVELFRSLLRFIRVWAKQRGVYGSFLGFPGGMAWAVCCAKICQMYPGVELSQIAARFFRTLSRWDWRQPVALDSSPAPTTPSAMGGSPDHPGTTPCQMTVLIPVGSGLSATSQVSDTTMKITMKELRRGYKMVQQVEICRAHWTDVYKEAKFFQRHRHYLEFDFMASSEAIFAAWSHWGRQKIQDVLRLFEQMSSNMVTLRPWPEWVAFKDSEWSHCSAVFVGLHLERGPSDASSEGPRRSFDLREPIVKFLEAISQWPEADKHANKFELLIKHVRLSELQTWLENKQRGLTAGAGSGAGTALQGLSSGSAGNSWHVSEEDPRPVQNCSV